MVVCGAFAHDDRAAVGIDGVGFVSDVAAAEINCLVSNLVEGGDPGVECRGGGITGEPDCFAVYGDGGTAVMLFLTFVDFLMSVCVQFLWCLS